MSLSYKQQTVQINEIIFFLHYYPNRQLSCHNPIEGCGGLVAVKTTRTTTILLDRSDGTSVETVPIRMMTVIQSHHHLASTTPMWWLPSGYLFPLMVTQKVQGMATEAWR